MNVEGSNPFTRSSFPEKKTGLNRRSFLFLSYPPLKRPPLSRKHLRGKAISSKAPRLQTWITVEQAHRGHGPLGDRSLPRKSSGYIRVAEKSTSPKNLRGGAISSKAPRLQTWITVEQAHRRHGPLGDRSLPRRSSGYIRVAKKSTSPKHLRGGAISPKMPRLQTWNTAEQAHRGHGPLGDRSLPRKSLGCIWGAKTQLSLTV